MTASWTGHELSRPPLKIGAHAITCERCAAKPGEWCVDLRTMHPERYMRTVHAERYEAAVRKGLA
jgi:hypothetical protein